MLNYSKSEIYVLFLGNGFFSNSHFNHFYNLNHSDHMVYIRAHSNVKIRIKAQRYKGY